MMQSSRCMQADTAATQYGCCCCWCRLAAATSAAAAKASGMSSSCRSPEEKSSIHNGRVSACHPVKAHLFFPFMLMGILHHRTDSARTTRHRIIMTPAALKPSPRPPPPSPPPLLPLAPASMLKPCRVDSLATNRPTTKLHTISPFLMHSRDLWAFCRVSLCSSFPNRRDATLSEDAHSRWPQGKWARQS